jgi:hypothetical protein
MKSAQLQTSRLQIYVLDASSSSLNDENIDLNMHTTSIYYENINSNQNENANKRSKLLYLSSIENNDEGRLLLF